MENLTKNWLKIVLFVIATFLLLITGMVGGYWWGTRKAKIKEQKAKLPLETQKSLPTQALMLTPTPDPTAGWRVYTSPPSNS